MKESLYHLDKSVIFHETFNDESTVRNNGGIPTDVTFSNGKATFNGTSSFISYNKFIDITKGEKTFYFIYKTDLNNSAEPILYLGVGLFSGDNIYFQNTNNILQLVVYSGGAIQTSITYDYTNRAGEWINITITLKKNEAKLYIDDTLEASDLTVSLPTVNGDFNICKNNNIGYGEACLDKFTIYNRALSKEEVELLYENSLYVEPKFDNEVLSIDSRKGSIYDKYENTIANTSVDIVKQGDICAQKYTSISTLTIPNSSKLSISDDHTVMCWVRCTSFQYNTWVVGKLGSTYNYLIAVNTLGVPNVFIYDGSILVQVNATYDVMKDGEWHLLVSVRDVLTNKLYLYIDGKQNNSVNDTTAGSIETTADVFIGKPPSHQVIGNVGLVKIIRDRLTTKQITHYYNATKKYFGK